MVGCGIGGPAVAIALKQAGIVPVVFEAYPRASADKGAFLNVASNGIDALRTIGVDPGVLAEGFPTPRMVMWSARGKRLGEVENGGVLADGSVSLTIRRAALHLSMRDEAERRGIRTTYDKRLIAIEHAEGGVVARFDDGTRAEGDLLVGADGIHSKTRRIVDPDCPPPRYTGQLSIGGVARGTQVAPTPGTYHMIFGRRAFFGYSVTVAGDAYWFANVGFDEEPARDTLGGIAAETWKRWLARLFASDVGPALEMIQETGDDVAAYPIYDLPKVPRWYGDRIVLVGDAAHATSPSSGQGASMAFEDAAVLAKCLRDTATPEAAFAAYEGLRRARVERVVRYSKQVGNTKIAGPVGSWFRDLFMPIGLKLFAGGAAHAWLYDHHIDWNERVS